jgi:invasion protein IalB
MQPTPILRTLLACAALAFPAATLAQDEAEPTEEQAPAAETLPMAPADAADEETYVAETHADWQILCSRFGEGQPELCEMYQLLETDEGPIAEISIRALPEGSGFPAGATITTPLETFLPAGVVFRVDAGQPRQEPFFVCTVIGCMARLGFEEAEVAAMQRGANAYITIVAIAAIEDPIELPVSLMGFTAALEDIQERMPVE